MTTPAPITVFSVDDHEIVRRGIRALFADEPGIIVVGDAGTADAALAVIPALAPDVAILGIRFPGTTGGVGVCAELRTASPRTRSLIYTGCTDDGALIAAIAAGAAGYVTKQEPAAHLTAAVRTVAGGQPALGGHATQTVMTYLRGRGTPAGDPTAALSGQERRVLALLGDGLTNRQIAAAMALSEKTVKNYATSLFAKLGLRNRAQAAALAARIATWGTERTTS